MQHLLHGPIKDLRTNFVHLFDPSSGKALPFPQLMNQYNLPAHHFIYPQQTVDFVVSLCPTRDLRFCTCLLDAFLDYQKHNISDICNLLNSSLAKSLHSGSTTFWNKDLHSSAAVDRILDSYNSTCAFSTNEFWQEQQFKIMHRAYIPYLMSTYSSDQQQCPRCSVSRTSLHHRLCPHISCYWDQLENFAAMVTGYQQCKDHFPLLFGSLDGPLLGLPKIGC